MAKSSEAPHKLSTLAKVGILFGILASIGTIAVVCMELLVWNKNSAPAPDTPTTKNPTLQPSTPPPNSKQPTTELTQMPVKETTPTAPTLDPTEVKTSPPTLAPIDWCPSGVTTTSISDNYHVGTEDDTTEPIIGGLDNIDKIIRIEVFRAKYFWYGMQDDVVTKIRVTYRLKDEQEVALTRGEHEKENPQGTLEIPEGVYLTSVNLSRNKNSRVIDYVVFCLSDNSCHGPWGGDKQNTLENLSQENGVIKSFFGDVVDWVYTLGCYYEVCSEE